MSETANDNPPPPLYAPPWQSQSYVTYFTDPELRAIDVVTQILDDGRLTNAQRWRVLDYAQARFGKTPGSALEGGDE